MWPMCRHLSLKVAPCCRWWTFFALKFLPHSWHIWIVCTWPCLFKFLVELNFFSTHYTVRFFVFLHMLLKKVFVLFSCEALAAYKTIWAITCMLPFNMISHIVLVHALILTEVTLKVGNNFYYMCFGLVVFKRSCCLVFFPTYCAFVGSAMLILHMSADRTRSKLLSTNATFLLFLLDAWVADLRCCICMFFANNTSCW